MEPGVARAARSRKLAQKGAKMASTINKNGNKFFPSERALGTIAIKGIGLKTTAVKHIVL